MSENKLKTSSSAGEKPTIKEVLPPSFITEEFYKLPRWALEKIRDDLRGRQIAEQKLAEAIKEHQKHIEVLTQQYENRLEDMQKKMQIERQEYKSQASTMEKQFAEALREKERSYSLNLEQKSAEVSKLKTQLEYWGLGNEQVAKGSEKNLYKMMEHHKEQFHTEDTRRHTVASIPVQKKLSPQVSFENVVDKPATEKDEEISLLDFLNESSKQVKKSSTLGVIPVENRPRGKSSPNRPGTPIGDEDEKHKKKEKDEKPKKEKKSFVEALKIYKKKQTGNEEAEKNNSTHTMQPKPHEVHEHDRARSLMNSPSNSRTLRRHTIMWTNLSLHLQSELAKKQRHLDNQKQLRRRAEEINLEISVLITKRASDESILKEAVEAKRRLPEIERMIQEKREEFEQVVKKIKQEKQDKREEKLKFEEQENLISILKDISVRATLIKSHRKIKLVPSLDVVGVDYSGPNAAGDGVQENVFLISPSDEDKQILKEMNALLAESVCGKSLSTYPYNKAKKMRDGEPICDRFFLSHYETCTIAALADGCGWGVPAKEAAIKVCTEFVEFMKKFKRDILDTRLAARLMLRALQVAHDAILEGSKRDSLFSLGTTTLLAGIVLPLARVVESAAVTASPRPQTGKYQFILTNLGDCKAFLYSTEKQRMFDITEGNRKNISDAKDPGGRLGPYKEDGSPDLRNLTIHSVHCQEGDIISLVSDGVHDNLDPQLHGILPSDLGVESDDNTWKSVKDTAQAYIAKSKWTESLLNEVVFGKYGAGTLPRSEITPALIANKLIDYVDKLTKPSREFMETKPNDKLPSNYQLFPGKMDHSTVLSFTIGSKKKLVRSNSTLSGSRHRTNSF